LYSYANGDPVNNHDPSGNVCERKSTDRLVCTNLGPGDAETMRDFLGGSAGDEFYSTLRTDPRMQAENCRGGFDAGQCRQIAQALSNLTLDANSRCRTRGVSATRRFQAGRFVFGSWWSNKDYGWAETGFPRAWNRIGLTLNAFGEGELANTISHEEWHIAHPFQSSHERYHYRAFNAGKECQGPV
jgi:hypothetical protein